MLGLWTELYDSETGGMEDGYAVASEMDYKKMDSIGEAMEAVVNLCFMIWPVGDAHHAAEGELVLRDGKVGRGGPEEVGRHLRRRGAEAERHQGRGEERTLVYKNALEEAKKVCRAHGINHASLFFGGAYVGGKNSQEIRNKIMNLVSGVKDQRVWADPRGAGASSSGTTRPAGLHGEWWQWRRPRGSPGTWRSPRRTRRPHLLGRSHEEEP